MAGGYLTGRLRRRNYDATEKESDIRDGSHGLTVWALGVLIGAVVTFSGVATAVSTATNAATTLVSGAASGAVNAAADAISDNDLLVDRLFRAPAGAPATADVASAADQRQEVGRIILSSLASGEMDQADRQYIIDTVAARTGIPAEEVQQRVDQAWTQAQELERRPGACPSRAAHRSRRGLHHSGIVDDWSRRCLLRRRHGRKPSGQADRVRRVEPPLVAASPSINDRPWLTPRRFFYLAVAQIEICLLRDLFGKPRPAGRLCAA